MQCNNILQEICKVSTMRAATAMSRFLKIPLKIDIKPLEIEPIQKINLPTYSDKNTVSLYMSIKSGNVSSFSSMLSTQKAAFAVCDLLFSLLFATMMHSPEFAKMTLLLKL